jgi:carboxymethylenebutenolidase
MCDDHTALAETVAPAGSGVGSGLSRRDFAAMSGAAAILAASPVHAAGGPALVEKMVSIPTADGHADAFFVAPAKGMHPGVLMWPDIAGLRDAYKAMARRLAGEGFAVLCVNHYYRTGPAPFVTTMAEWRTPVGQEKLKPAIAAITPARTTADARAFVAWLDVQGAVSKAKKLATCGYCMGGPYTVRTAAAVPARIGAAASLHGAGLVTDQPDSPHLLIAKTSAAFLFAIARNDDARAPGDKEALRKAAAVAHRPAEVAVYAADHGWCTIDAPVYDHAEAEKAWSRMLATFRQA